MIITDKFVWFHLPKTAGTMTRSILNTLYSGDILYNSCEYDKPREQRYDHLNKIPKEFDDADRDWIINFRKLPYWLISRINHIARNNESLPCTRAEALDLFKAGRFQKGPADDQLYPFYYVFSRLSPTVKGKTSVILQDNYFESMWEIVSLYPVNQNNREKALPFRHLLHPHFAKMEENKNKITKKKLEEMTKVKINHHPKSNDNLLHEDDILNLTDDELINIYRANPQWRVLEQKIYGTLPKFLQDI